MTSIREVLRRLLQRRMKPEHDVHRSDFSYAVYWTKQAREWGADRRRHVYAAVRAILDDPDFIANEFERRYAAPAIDSQKHAGASIVALEQVLLSFADEQTEKE